MDKYSVFGRATILFYNLCVESRFFKKIFVYFISGLPYILLLKMCLVLNGPYLLDYASPGHNKPYICELAPNLLLMPINFVLGQIDIQTVIRHDLEVLSDLLRGAGTLQVPVLNLVLPYCTFVK